MYIKHPRLAINIWVPVTPAKQEEEKPKKPSKVKADAAEK